MKKTALALALSLAPAFAAYANDNQFEQAASLDDLIEYAAPEGNVGFIYYSSSPDAETHAGEIAATLYNIEPDDLEGVQFFIAPSTHEIAEGSVQGVNSQGIMDVYTPAQARMRIFLSTIISSDAPPSPEELEADRLLLEELRQDADDLERRVECVKAGYSDLDRCPL